MKKCLIKHFYSLRRGLVGFLSQGVVYALNGAAVDAQLDGKTVQSLAPIKRGDRSTNGLIEKALTICE